jgi:hypothetical protein
MKETDITRFVGLMQKDAGLMMVFKAFLGIVLVLGFFFGFILGGMI